MDPETGVPAVHRTGKKAGLLRKPPDSSSSFRSNEAYAQAEYAARNSPEFLKGAMAGKGEIKVKSLALRDALGDGYLRHVEGRTTIGLSEGTRAVDFADGTVTAIYRRNASGGYDLRTMFPGGR